MFKSVWAQLAAPWHEFESALHFSSFRHFQWGWLMCTFVNIQTNVLFPHVLPNRLCYPLLFGLAVSSAGSRRGSIVKLWKADTTRSPFCQLPYWNELEMNVLIRQWHNLALLQRWLRPDPLALRRWRGRAAEDSSGVEESFKMRAWRGVKLILFMCAVIKHSGDRLLLLES